MGNIVAIVGRPNVGKSTFFNRLTESRQAIMDNQSGVTRDRIYGQVEWTDRQFTIIDTGGYVEGSEDIFEKAIKEQIRIALEESSVILFMVDCQTGVTEMDKEFANFVRRYPKPVILIANKADEPSKSQLIYEFYELGLGEAMPVSAQTGTGTGEVLDKITELLPKPEKEEEEIKLPKISILGRPNVGKSSLLNLLTGENRSIVTDIAGTTRDAVHTHYKAFGKEFILIDTAGIRRKSKVRDDIEFYSVMRAIKALESSHVCIIMLDATKGIESQDVNLIWLAARKRKGIILMVNKWDLVEKDTQTAINFQKEIFEKIAPINYTPIFFTSVLEKQRVLQTITKALEVYDNLQQKIPTSKLNELLLPEINRVPPPALKGKLIKINYITQLPKLKATFAFFCNLPQYIKDPYKRFLENKMREFFPLDGVPIQIFFRKK